MDRFFNSFGAVSSATQSHAQQAVLEAGMYVGFAGLIAIAITILVVKVANKANRNQQARHFGTPAE